MSFVEASARRQEARKLLTDGVAPDAAKRDAKHVKMIAAEHMFEAVAFRWMEKTKSERAAIT